MSLAEQTALLTKAFDSFTEGFKQIDTDHYYIHQGKKYGYSENISIASAGTYIYEFTTPTVVSGLQVHYRPPLITTSGDKLLIQLYEASTTSGGSDIKTSVFNYCRSCTDTTNMQTVKKGVSHSTTGTLILNDYIGGGTSVGGNVIGASAIMQEERVLKVNTLYTVKLTNNSSNTNIVNIKFQWYEEDGL